MKLNQKGFGLVEGLLIAVSVAVIGFGGYYILGKNRDTQTTNENSAKGNADGVKKSNLNKFSDDTAMYSLEYPNNWTLFREVTDSGLGDESMESTVTLTADSGLVITLEHNYGGRGGDCDPAGSDTPHSPSNRCGTSEVISAERTGAKTLAINAAFDASAIERFEEVDVYLVHTKKTDDSTKYSLGLEESKGPIDLNMPNIRGAIAFDRTVLSYYTSPDYGEVVDTGAYIDIKMSELGISENYYKRTDVQEAEDILRSLRFQYIN